MGYTVFFFTLQNTDTYVLQAEEVELFVYLFVLSQYKLLTSGSYISYLCTPVLFNVTVC